MKPNRRDSPGKLDSRIEFRPTATLHPHPRNARLHSKRQIRQIADSIAAFGHLTPIILDEKGTVLAGHARLAAAKLIGLAEVPTITAAGLTEAQQRSFMLADNKLCENAGWDRRLLADELGELAPLLEPIGLDLTITGFDPPEIDGLFHDLGPSRPDPDDDVPAPDPAHVVTRTGDVWELGGHRLTCGDARSRSVLASLMLGEEARMIFTDPPYNVPIAGHVQGRGRVKHREFAHASGEMSAAAFTAFLRESLSNLAAPCAEGGIAFVFMDWRHMGELLAAGATAFEELKNLVVWNKTSPGQGSFYRSQHELIFVFKARAGAHVNAFGLGAHGRTRSNVWTYPGANSFGAGRTTDLAMHPTVKPVALVADAMRDCSMQGDIVLDGFMGSGTTIMAGEKVGRRCFGIECDPIYVDVAIRRWERATKAEATLMGDGRTFAEIAVFRTSEARDNGGARGASEVEARGKEP